MTHEQILKKAIEKAVKNGYPMAKSCYDYAINEMQWFSREYIFTTIFDHRFAKAFWGEGKIIIKNRRVGDDPKVIIPVYEFAWKWHLQQMVLEEEPLNYLEKFL